jgi:uncharacterized protein (DUF885 family)
MRALAAFALWLSLSSPSFAQGEAPLLDRSVKEADSEGMLERQRLYTLFQQYLAQEQDLDPERATSWGLHAGDDRLTKVDDDTRRKRAAMLDRFLILLPGNVDRSRLAQASQWDFDLFERHLRFEIAELKRTDPRSSSPQSYLRLDGVAWLIDKDFNGPINRATVAADRLRRLPLLLSQAPSLLQNPPKPWTEQALLATEGASDYLLGLSKHTKIFYDVDSSVREVLDPAVAIATRAVASYQSYLKEDLLLRSEGSFAVGSEAYLERLQLVDGCDVTPGSLRRRAKRELKRARKALKKAAAQAVPGKEWRDALLTEGKNHPELPNLLTGWQAEAQRVKKAVESAHLASLPPGPIAIIEMPAFDRPFYAFQRYSPPGPFDDTKGGVLYVATPAAGSKPEEAERFLAMSSGRERMQVVSAELGWPGRHYMALRLHETPSPIRRLLRSGLVTEGWPLYAMQLGLDTGLYGSETAQLWVLNEQLTAAAEAMLDVDLHTGDMSFDDAVAFLREETALSDSAARAEVTRITEEPTRSALAIEGWLEMTDLHKDAERRLGTKFSELQFQQRALSYGALPPKLFGPVMIDAWASETAE